MKHSKYYIRRGRRVEKCKQETADKPITFNFLRELNFFISSIVLWRCALETSDLFCKQTTRVILLKLEKFTHLAPVETVLFRISANYIISGSNLYTQDNSV